MAVVYPTDDPTLGAPVTASPGSRVISFAENHLVLSGVLLLVLALLVGYIVSKIRGQTGTTSGTSTGTSTDASGQQTLYVPTSNTFENVYNNTAPLNSPTTTTTITNNDPTNGGTVNVNPPASPTPVQTLTYLAHLRAKTSNAWDLTKSGPPLRVSPADNAKEVAYPAFGSTVTLLSPTPSNGWYTVSQGGQTLYLNQRDVTGVSSSG